MDNSQLWQAFSSANSKFNMFDRVLALKKFDKTYKQTEFYKKTKMPLKEFQEYCVLFRLNDILDSVATYASVEGVGQFLEDVLDSMNEDVIQAFFGRIADQFDPQVLVKSNQELQQQISQLRK